MKNLLLTLLFLGASSFAQIQDLGALAAGDLVGFSAIYDKDEDLYGYLTMFSNGYLNDEEKKFEYVILDKNLNKVANNQFTTSKYAYSFFPYMNFKGKLILVPHVDESHIGVFNYGQFVYPEIKEVDLENNTIEKKFNYCYEDGIFVECAENKKFRQQRKDERAEKKEKGYLDKNNLMEHKYGGYILTEYQDFTSYVTNNSITFFNENQEAVWEYKYNQNGDKNNQESIAIIDFDEDYLYGVKTKQEKRDKAHYLFVLNLKTGEVTKEEQLAGYEDEVFDFMTGIYSQTHYIDSEKSFDDKIIMVSRFYQNSSAVGFIRWVLDKNELSLKSESILWTDLAPFVEKINAYGKVEQNYSLDVKDLFILENGNIGFLFEKLKINGYSGIARNTDMVFAATDAEFNIESVQVFEKEKSKYSYSDYLFSQYLNKDEDVVFFFQDYAKDDETREKNWNLYINTWLSGTFNQESIPISSGENMIYPYVAKEGYILLREFNEKEKYNQIRLEKLNY